ncbi:bacterioferritin-associated ferredoxin [Porticoccus sp. W117]|uniref:bacterioferritin-associated ferredoxin n=1 Tax=Porticoccus sp. W117 TaxID=3054777 RepID=UPI0025922509|nr:bacterioferritin-associated ferredoxin [Porticoccus sp. W117]MDM3871221.1 bacterioferritin-associated ferredoxin [Porticoccus sp. W117]
MYVCICRAVTDNQIRQEVSHGASTMREVGQRLGVGTQCGKCSKHARSVIREAIANRPMEDPAIWEPSA